MNGGSGKRPSIINNNINGKKPVGIVLVIDAAAVADNIVVLGFVVDVAPRKLFSSEVHLNVDVDVGSELKFFSFVCQLKKGF